MYRLVNLGIAWCKRFHQFAVFYGYSSCGNKDGEKYIIKCAKGRDKPMHWYINVPLWNLRICRMSSERYKRWRIFDQTMAASEVAGWMQETSCLRLWARARKSHSTWMPCQKVSDWAKKAPKRMDMAGVIERLPSTISLMALGGTPMARAIAFWEMLNGLRYSSNNISPGVIAIFMDVTYRVIVVCQW